MGNDLALQPQALLTLSAETNDEIKKWVGLLWMVYPTYGAGYDVLDARMKFFKQNLLGYTKEEIGRAFEKYSKIRDCLQFPVPAQITGLIEDERESERIRKMFEIVNEKEKTDV